MLVTHSQTEIIRLSPSQTPNHQVLLLSLAVLYAASRMLVLLIFAPILWLALAAEGYPGSGIVIEQLSSLANQVNIPFSLYAGARIGISLKCSTTSQDPSVLVEWVVRQTPCLETRLIENDGDGDGLDDGVENNNNRSFSWTPKLPNFTNPYVIDPDELGEDAVILYRKSKAPQSVQCQSEAMPPATVLPDGEKNTGSNDIFAGWHECHFNESTKLSQCHLLSHTSADAAVKNTTITKTAVLANSKDRFLLRAPRDGIYTIMVRLQPAHTPTSDGIDTSVAEFSANITVNTRHDYGYLPAVAYPLLPFYGCMSAVYAVLGLIWLALCAHGWRDLIRIQVWIGFVIFIGMLEKALFYIEFETLNKTGQPTAGFAIVAAELMSAFKKSLSRMLIVIVSIGFGITRPRLGPDFARVLALGILYFVLATIEAMLRLLHTREKPLGLAALALIPLTLLDTLIWYWVFTALLSTIRALRARRNVVKLRLFVSFMNTLALAVIASLAYQAWSIWVHHRVRCIREWRTLWLDEAFWHVLFSVVLLVIMLLWRPTENSQRFAFTMMLEEDVIQDKEAETVFLQELHHPSAQLNGQSKSINEKKKHQDLLWTDERLPQSITEALMSECGAGSDDDEVELMTSSRRHRDAQAKMQ